MSVPLNGYLYQDIPPYTHQWADLWSGFDECVISWYNDSTSGTFFYVMLEIGRVKVQTFNTAEVGVHNPNFWAHYSAYPDHSYPGQTHTQTF